MKRTFIATVLVIFFSSATHAQDLTIGDKTKIIDTTFDLLNELENSFSLTQLLDAKIDTVKIGRFLNLFEKGAYITDHLTSASENENGMQFASRSLSVEEYVKEIRQNYPNGLSIVFTNIFLDYPNSQSDTLKVYVEKKSRGNRVDGYALNSIDTSLIRIGFSQDFTGAKIYSLETIGLTTDCYSPNDQDCDGIPNDKDQCPDDPDNRCLCKGDRDCDGKIDRLDPCPDDPEDKCVCENDKDCDGIPDDEDRCPEDPTNSCTCRNDIDCDGIPNRKDPCPEDPNNSCVCENDNDCDGIPNSEDKCPDDPSNTCTCKNDKDCDGIVDRKDPCPDDPKNSCICENDNDCDGIPNSEDKCPDDPSNTCTCKNDKDCDGIVDRKDPCPDDPKNSCICENDKDCDGISDQEDPCPEDAKNACYCENDDDCDGMPNSKDPCPNDPNKIEPGNCGCGVPESENCGATKTLSLWIGPVGNIVNFGSDQLLPSGFDQVISEEISELIFSDPERKVNLMYGLEINHYFKGGKLGFGTGVYYTQYEATASLDKYAATYQISEENGSQYERMVTIEDVREFAEVGYLSIPILLNFKQKLNLSGKLRLLLNIGPTISFKISNLTSSTAKGDFEKTYSKINNQDVILKLTQEAIEARVRSVRVDSVDQIVKQYFDERRDIYDIGLNENLSTSPGLNQSIAFGGIFRIGLDYELNDKFNLLFTTFGQMISAASKKRASFILSDQVGELESLYNGLDYDRAVFSSIGVNIGLSFKF